MSPDVQQAIYQAWPEIFRHKDGEVAVSAMGWGIECDNGWAALIDAVCAVVVAHSGTGTHPIPAARQVKQKFGSLRIRFEGVCEYCNGASLMASIYSERVCEISGKRGVRCGAQGRGIKTLSLDVAESLGYQVAENDVAIVPPSASNVPEWWGSLAGAFTDLASWNGSGESIRFGDADGNLLVDIPATNPGMAGAIACATALSKCIDPQTGKVRLSYDIGSV